MIWRFDFKLLALFKEPLNADDESPFFFCRFSPPAVVLQSTRFGQTESPSRRTHTPRPRSAPHIFLLSARVCTQVASWRMSVQSTRTVTSKRMRHCPEKNIFWQPRCRLEHLCLSQKCVKFKLKKLLPYSCWFAVWSKRKSSKQIKLKHSFCLPFLLLSLHNCSIYNTLWEHSTSTKVNFWLPPGGSEEPHSNT